MKRALVPSLALALLLVPASGASAGVPTADDPSVVVPTSIGGVKLGMPEGKALAAWGGAGRAKCTVIGTTKRCTFGDTDSPQGSGTIEFHSHQVSAISLDSGHKKTGEQIPSAAKSILAIKGKNGVGIGSTYAKVKAAYPKADLIGTPSSSIFYLNVDGRQKSDFTFTFSAKRLVDMTLTDGTPA